MKDCWYSASNEADDGIGITGWMFGAAVKFLSQYHKHGEQIRRLHNRSYGKEYEDIDGIVNPAVITIEAHG